MNVVPRVRIQNACVSDTALFSSASIYYMLCTEVDPGHLVRSQLGGKVRGGGETQDKSLKVN